jgi:hypothetical protein
LTTPEHWLETSWPLRSRRKWPEKLVGKAMSMAYQ